MGRIQVDLAGFTFYKVNPTSGTPFNPVNAGVSKTETFTATTLELRALDVCASGYAVKFQLSMDGTNFGDFIAVSAGQSYSCPASKVKKVRLMNLNGDGTHNAVYQVIGWY